MVAVRGGLDRLHGLVHDTAEPSSRAFHAPDLPMGLSCGLFHSRPVAFKTASHRALRKVPRGVDVDDLRGPVRVPPERPVGFLEGGRLVIVDESPAEE